MLITLSRTEKEIEDLIFTLEIAIKNLPTYAHPEHNKRLNKLIEGLKCNNRTEQYDEEDIGTLDDEVLLKIFEKNYGKISTDLWNGEKIIEELFDRGYELEL
jgi:hypothetical protein